VLGGFIEALNAADVKALAGFFAPDATVFFPLASLPLRLEDRGQITAAFGAFFEAMRAREPGPRYMNLAPEDTRVQFVDDVAVVTFHLKGEQMISRRTLVLRKLSGTWVIVHLHASNLSTQK
jgi:ketosteroid isomerase-like protein